MAVRSSVINEEKGITRVIRQYARGFDIKFRNDSLVIIIANGSTLTGSEVH